MRDAWFSRRISSKWFNNCGILIKIYITVIGLHYYNPLIVDASRPTRHRREQRAAIQNYKPRGCPEAHAQALALALALKPRIEKSIVLGLLINVIGIGNIINFWRPYINKHKSSPTISINRQQFINLNFMMFWFSNNLKNLYIFIFVIYMRYKAF